jgi:hypothetical protein
MPVLAAAPPGLLPRAALNDGQRAAMFSLLARHFEGVTRDQFEADLAAKDWVIEVRRDGRLDGFTTLRVTASLLEGEPVTVVYSGDTIVAPEAWGTPALPRAWIAGVNALRRTLPARRCFWLLLTSGFRTYRLLPVFWREFFPRCDTPTPPAAARHLAQLAREGYGDCFDSATGIVRFPRPQRLRGPLAAVPAGRQVNPHVAFFLARNPGHTAGDELVCLTEISEANLTAAGRRMVAAPLP